jgi:hypothetical protein
MRLKNNRIPSFQRFILNESNRYNGDIDYNYIEVIPQKGLKLEVSEEAQSYLKEYINSRRSGNSAVNYSEESNLISDFFENYIGDGIEFYGRMSDYGHMSDSPFIVYNGSVYIYPDYQVKLLAEELAEKGTAFYEYLGKAEDYGFYDDDMNENYMGGKVTEYGVRRFNRVTDTRKKLKKKVNSKLIGISEADKASTDILKIENEYETEKLKLKELLKKGALDADGYKGAIDRIENTRKTKLSSVKTNEYNSVIQRFTYDTDFQTTTDILDKYAVYLKSMGYTLIDMISTGKNVSTYIMAPRTNLKGQSKITVSVDPSKLRGYRAVVHLENIQFEGQDERMEVKGVEDLEYIFEKGSFEE